MSALMGFAGSPNHYGEHPFILGPIFADQYNGWPVRVISLAHASLPLALSLYRIRLSLSSLGVGTRRTGHGCCLLALLICLSCRER